MVDEVSGSKTEKSFLMENGFCSNSKTEIKAKEQESVGMVHEWMKFAGGLIINKNVRAIKRALLKQI